VFIWKENKKDRTKEKEMDTVLHEKYVLIMTTPRNIKDSEQLFTLWPHFYRFKHFMTGRPTPPPHQLIMIKALKKYIYILLQKEKN